MVSPIAFTLGALTWSASEYLIHRFVGHGPRRRGPAKGLSSVLTPSGLARRFNDEHLHHHADPSYFAPTSHKAAAAVAALGLAGSAASFVAGRRLGFSYGLGLAATYFTYEVLHRRVHTHPPKGPYSRWIRRHHLVHHHRNPRMNHGVTSPLWDLVAGTEIPLETIKIPRHMAPAWLVDPVTRAVRPEHAADYALVGGKKAVVDEGPSAPTSEPQAVASSA
jgi:hypothetical protein